LLREAEDPGAVLVKKPLGDQLLHRLAALKVGVQLDEWFGPEETLGEALVHVLSDAWVPDPDEGSGERGIVDNHLVPELEDVHIVASA
jgi:hypothetical protein